MKNNEEGRLELKKVVARFIARGFTVTPAQETENMTVCSDDNRCDSDEDGVVWLYMYNITSFVFKVIFECILQTLDRY